MNRYEEPNTKGAAVTLTLIFALIFVLIAFGAWAFFRQPLETVVIQEIVSEEGVAKASMILELTGIEFEPEIAKWANINFSGSTVSIDTHTINLWDGKKWRELER